MKAAHRRPAFSVDAPTLTRHVVIRLAEDLRTTAQFNGQASQGAVIYALVRNFLETASNTSLEKEDPADTLLVQLLDTEKAGYRLRLRADIYAEYITLTYLADAFEIKEPSGGLDISSILSTLREGDCPRSAQDRSSDQFADYLFDSFWEGVSARFSAEAFFRSTASDLEKIRGKSALGEKVDNARASKIGAIVADFRGLALCPREITKRLTKRNQDEMGLPLAAGRLNAESFNEDVYQFVRNRPHFFSSVYKLTPDLTEKEATQDANVVLCGICDGVAIYGSSIGRPDNAEFGKPLRYFVIYDGFAANQLGRILRRLHDLGELRIAALLDNDRIRVASTAIRALGIEVDRLVGMESGGLDEATTSGQKPNRAKAHDQVPFGTVVAWNAQLARIREGVGHGGLVYRVNRSRLYARTFRERIQDLRIVRIEGWQTYDEFVRRNLFMEFDYISAVGDRHNSLEARLNWLRLASQVDSTALNADQLRHLGEVARQQVDALKDYVATVAHLLTIAEIVGWAAFAYYAGSGAADLLTAFYQALFRLDWEDPNVATKAVCIALALPGYWALQKLVERRQSQSP